MVHSSWFMVHGSWCMVHGAWCRVHGSWCMMHGAWCTVRSLGRSLEACVCRDRSALFERWIARTACGGLQSSCEAGCGDGCIDRMSRMTVPGGQSGHWVLHVTALCRWKHVGDPQGRAAVKPLCASTTLC